MSKSETKAKKIYKIIIIIIFCGAQDYQHLERLLPSILPQLHLWLSQFLRCVIAPLSLHFVLLVYIAIVVVARVWSTR